MAVALLVAACVPGRPAAPASATPPAVAGEGGGSRLTAEQGFALITQAYVILLDQYVGDVDPVALLDAAWSGFVEALPAGVPRPAPPVLSGTDPMGDLRRFREAYLDAAARAGGGLELQAMLAHAAARRMAASLNDCHTSFSDPQQAQDQDARLRGQVRFAGIGVRIKRANGNGFGEAAGAATPAPSDAGTSSAAKGPILIWELLDGGSAGKAGIRPGDAILKVDGHDVSSLTLDEVAALIRGPEGTKVRLTIQRADGRRTQDFVLPRVPVVDPVVQTRWLPGEIGYVRLSSFTRTAEDELRHALGDFERRGVQGWILDLRTNTGGDLPAVLSTLSKFLKDGPFGYEVDRRGAQSALGPDGTYLPRQHPMVVLVGDSSASGAELFAAAVQRYGAATLVGTRTSGCLGIGSAIDLTDGSRLLVTVQKLLGPGGEELNKAGVVPDQVVEISRAELASGKDPQLQRALAILGAPAAR